MDNKTQSDELRNSSPVVPGNSGTVPVEKDLNPTQDGTAGKQDNQLIEGEDVLNRHPDSHMSQKPFPQG